MVSQGQKHQPEWAHKTSRASPCFVQTLAPPPQRFCCLLIPSVSGYQQKHCSVLLTSCPSTEVGDAHTYSGPSPTNTSH